MRGFQNKLVLINTLPPSVKNSFSKYSVHNIMQMTVYLVSYIYKEYSYSLIDSKFNIIPKYLNSSSGGIQLKVVD